MNENKIFGIGLSKTATTSLNRALVDLDFNAVHGVTSLLEWRGSKLLTMLCNIANRLVMKFNCEFLLIRPLLYRFGENKFHFEKLADYDSVSDLPIGIYYRELDKLYPGSKYILTTRDEEQWVESAKRHFHINKATQKINSWNKMRIETYGCILFDEKKFRSAYREHIRDVREYFKQRPNDLLEVDLCNGPEWDSICEFLGCETPNKAFPHMNKTKSA